MKQQFNDSCQMAAIKHGNGPACVLAGPGSGKTYIITHRIQNLISDRGVSPDKILVITFTKAAAMEMRQRFLNISYSNTSNVVFGTFHSIYLSFLKLFNPKNVPKIIDPIEQKRLVKKIISTNKRLSADINFSEEQTDDLISAISFYKSRDLSIPDTYPKDLFTVFIKEYDECLYGANVMDFDDILIKCRDLLRENPLFAIKLRERFDHILVDEFQDINPLQYEILKMILNEENNLFVVGDDDQSIYGFRGATPDIMKIFMEDFKNAVRIELKMNYRTAQCIIDASLKVISGNISRIKNVEYISHDPDDKGLCKITLFESKNEEMEYIKNKIIKCEEEGKSYCILVRTNKDAAWISDFFENNGIFKDRDDNLGNIRYEIYDDIMAYISFCKRNDRSSILKIIRAPATYISRDIFTEPIVYLDELITRFRGTIKGDQLEKLSRTINILKKSSPYAFITYLFNIAGYRDHISGKYTGFEKEKALKVLNECLELSSKAKDISELYGFLAAADIKKSTKKKYENVMTFHSSKGLEFDTVILPDVNEGKIPGRSALRSGNSEEERRLFYVAMTRARSELFITAIKGNDSIRMLPSRFIIDLIDK